MAAHLVATQLEGDSDVNGLVDDANNRAHQGHKKQWEPDDGHEEQDDEAAHAILNNLLFLLPLGLWVFLAGDRICVTSQLCSCPALPCAGFRPCSTATSSAPDSSFPAGSQSCPPCSATPVLKAMVLGLPRGPIKSSLDWTFKLVAAKTAGAQDRQRAVGWKEFEPRSKPACETKVPTTQWRKEIWMFTCKRIKVDLPLIQYIELNCKAKINETLRGKSLLPYM